MDRIRDYVLKENQYLVISTGPGTYYGFKVIRKQDLILTYNFATETANNIISVAANNIWPMVPYGTTSIPTGYQSYYVELNKMPLAKIQNIADVFKIENINQIYQVFMGISPSYLRVGLRLNTASVTTLSQSIAPSQSFIDLFDIDGFTSPYNEPSPESEFYVLKPLTVGFTLMNPVTIPINPRLQFFINRLMVEPIPQNLHAPILNNAVPAKKVSLGSIDQVIGGFNDFANYQMKVGGV
ncbi:MAG: hypothetical protein ACPLVI_06000 [Thermoplasmata archaeon]